MRDIMFKCPPNSPRLTDVKDTNISALISPKVIRRQRSLTTPIDLEKTTSVPNFPPISMTKCDGQNGPCLRKSMDDVMPTGGESIRQVYLPQKPRPPRPGTPTFHSPFFRRRAQTHNPLEKRVLSEPALETSLVVRNEQIKGQIHVSENVLQSSPRLGSRQGSRSLHLVRPKLKSKFSSSTQETISNISTEEINVSTELVHQQGKLASLYSSDGSLDNAPTTRYTRQLMNRRNDQNENSIHFFPDTSPTHDRIIESDELIMDKITDLPTKDLVDKCQKWLEGVEQANERTPMV